MTDPFLGEIRMFAGSYAPYGWAFCAGQLLPISQNTALFSLLGTYYGGNGTSNFALPNLNGSVPVGQGQGPGLSDRVLGETGGAEAVGLLVGEMPSHTHQATAVSSNGDLTSPAALTTWAPARFGRAAQNLYSTGAPDVVMNANALALAGGNQPHNNMPPYLAVTFIIALQGIFPSRP
ncbi:MAG: phage tail protein [Jatrophihabitans sp.]|uniref:phage tail protein n=1 Tax=Jatrophihabitans sp. TaxID=1932789 RepID=UPI003F8081FA